MRVGSANRYGATVTRSVQRFMRVSKLNLASETQMITQKVFTANRRGQEVAIRCGKAVAIRGSTGTTVVTESQVSDTDAIVDGEMIIWRRETKHSGPDMNGLVGIALTGRSVTGSILKADFRF